MSTPGRRDSEDILEVVEGLRTTDSGMPGDGLTSVMSIQTASDGPSTSNARGTWTEAAKKGKGKKGKTQKKPEPKKKKEGNFFQTFQNPFALLSKDNTRNVTSGLGHVDGRSLRKDDSHSFGSPNYDDSSDEEDGSRKMEALGQKRDLRRSQSNLNAMNDRMVTSMNAFVVDNQSQSVKYAAKSLKEASSLEDTFPPSKKKVSETTRRRHAKVVNKYIGLVPTAPVRDQPVGGGSDDKVNLRFRYKLTNLRRKVINERDGNSKVVRFNESRMAKFGWLAVWQGTVFAKPSAPFIWFQLSTLFILAWLSFAISYLCSKYAHTSVSWSDFDEENIIQVWEVLDEFKVVADTAQVLTTLVSFLLGLYVTKTVDIWWNIRHELLQGVLNTIDSMCARLAIYFPGNTQEDEEAKETILRYGVLSIKLLFKDAREVDSWNIKDRKRLGCDSLGDLVDEGLLLQHEKELLKDCPSRSQVVWVWIASLFTKWCLDGRLPSPVENQNTVLEECNVARNNIAMILARINTQYPMSYSHLVISMVKVLLIIQALVAGYIFNMSLWTGYYYWMCTQIVYLLIWTIFHQAMIDIKEHITNPFRDNPCDFSEMIQSARSLNTCRAFFKAGKHPPYAHKNHTNPAALPPQLIVRQIIGKNLRKKKRNTDSPSNGTATARTAATTAANSTQTSPTMFSPGRMSTPGATPTHHTQART
jgi:hypothetical protein